jgi:Plant protein of unknown function (DUF946).
MSNLAHQFRLIYRYRPVVFLHSKEIYYPSSIEYILQNSSIYHNNYRIPKQPTKENLLKIEDEYGLPLHIDIYDTCWRGQSEVNNVPMYVHIYETDKYIVGQYVFIYPYNGPFKICCKEYGSHQFDLEHISTFINKETEEIDKIYFGAHKHYDGELVDKENIEFILGRPVVYSALHSHGCYWKRGTFNRVCLLANDKTNRGCRWDTSRLELLTEHTKWNNFRGKIGAERTAKYHDWYDNEEEESANCCSRIFCPCF